MNQEIKPGTIHPLSIVTDELVSVFVDLGFEIAIGPEIATEYDNFDSLNVPKDHPARDMQDTFWIKDSPGKVLRTHISSMQVPYMKTHKPPFKMISPGKVFRNEATDATHEMQYNYMEGLVVAEGISVAHLKGVLLEFIKKLFGDNADIRLRPSFFPFVEPGFEIDVWTGEKWIEILGAGMVHPKVLEHGGIDPKKFTGFAFGMGVDRIMLLKYKIPDVRLSYQGDLRLNQF